MIVSIHQPNYLGNLSFFYKIKMSDIFVFLDNVQFTRGGWINRNRIKTPTGVQWLTVPVYHKAGQLIKDVRIDNSTDWRKKHLKTLEMNYKRSPRYDMVMEVLWSYYYKNWKYLLELNILLIEMLLSVNKIFSVKDLSNITSTIDKERSYDFRFASALNIDGESTDRLINIVKEFGGDTYLSGHGAKNYLEPEKFEKAGIKLVYSDFEHPVYSQLWDSKFVPNLSIIDALFNGVEL